MCETSSNWRKCQTQGQSDREGEGERNTRPECLMLASVGIGHSSPSAINSKSLFELLLPVRARTQFLTVSLLFGWNKWLCPRRFLAGIFRR